MQPINKFINYAFVVCFLGTPLLMFLISQFYHTDAGLFFGFNISGFLVVTLALIGRHQTLKHDPRNSSSIIAAWIALLFGLGILFPVFVITFGFLSVVLVPYILLLFIGSYLLRKKALR